MQHTFRQVNTTTEVIIVDEDKGLGLLKVGEVKSGPAPLNGSHKIELAYAYVRIEDEGVAEELNTARLIHRSSTTGVLTEIPKTEIQAGALRLLGIEDLSLQQQEVCVAAPCGLLLTLREDQQ